MPSTSNLKRELWQLNAYQNISLFTALDGDIPLLVKNGKKWNSTNRPRAIIRCVLTVFWIYSIYATIILRINSFRDGMSAIKCFTPITWTSVILNFVRNSRVRGLLLRFWFVQRDRAKISFPWLYSLQSGYLSWILVLKHQKLKTYRRVSTHWSRPAQRRLLSST